MRGVFMSYCAKIKWTYYKKIVAKCKVKVVCVCSLIPRPPPMYMTCDESMCNTQYLLFVILRLQKMGGVAMSASVVPSMVDEKYRELEPYQKEMEHAKVYCVYYLLYYWLVMLFEGNRSCCYVSISGSFHGG